MIKPCTYATVLAIVSTTNLFAQSLIAQPSSVFQLVEPSSIGLDAEKLAEIDSLLQSEVESGEIVGCMALIARGDQVGYVRTWGQRDRAKDLPMTEDTIFRIYSMTKPITSVAIMQLVEAGKLELDDPIEQHLPALANRKVQTGKGTEAKLEPANRSITVRDLLRHTSGLTYGFFGNTEVDRAYRSAGVLMRDVTIEETVKKLGEIPLLYQPGTRWHYSVSTDVLGRLVEVVSGQPFDAYLQEHIFTPLDMKDTSFVVPESKRDRFAVMYAPDGEGGLRPARGNASSRFVNLENKYFSGGGGLCSTTRDFLRFSQALLGGGERDGVRILQSETLAEMTRNQLEGDAKRRGFQFGLGFSISQEGEISWGGAAGTRFYVNPSRDLITIFMIQINPYQERNYGTQFKQIVYAADLRAPNSSENLEKAGQASEPIP